MADSSPPHKAAPGPGSAPGSTQAPADGGVQATSWSRLRAAEETVAGEAPKPFTTPPGYKPPSLGEQWLYATRRHPYYRYGYGAAVATGLALAWVATARRAGDATPPAKPA